LDEENAIADLGKDQSTVTSKDALELHKSSDGKTGEDGGGFGSGERDLMVAGDESPGGAKVGEVPGGDADGGGSGGGGEISEGGGYAESR
jgi:hypothetical protein